MRLGLALLCCLAAPASAETPMTADEFDAWSTGQTLDYSIDGQFWGSERHLPDRRTQDAVAGGDCVDGRWFPQGDAICFAYDGSPGPHCWRFFRRDGRVLAELVGDAGAARIEVTLSPTPLACAGPDVGA